MVANFGSTEDDGTFWSRLIQPEAADQADEALAPRSTRNTKSYAEANQPEKSTKQKKRGVEPREKRQKRSGKAIDAPVNNLPMIDGAIAQVRGWSFANLTKKDASQFVRAVKRFGNPNQINLIVAEVGGVIESAPEDAQIELFELLLDGCQEAASGGNMDTKGTLLDFFGVPVKAYEVLERAEELQLLAKRIRRYQDPVSQFRLITNHKSPQWSKSCGWNAVDDARLLLGIHYHGFGNWEKIRLDARLGLTRKIAPVTLGDRETFLPRAPNLDNRASALLQKEFANVNGKIGKVKRPREVTKRVTKSTLKGSNNRSNDVQEKAGSPKRSARLHKDILKRKRAEPQVKEEGEISESEQERHQYKEEKWMEWCADVMEEDEQTLMRLERLQTTSLDLPKEKVLARIRKYLQLLGKKIDKIVQQQDVPHKQSRMTVRLWNYVSTFSNLSGERLHEIYSKLRDEQAEGGVGPSHRSTSAAGPPDKDTDSSQFPTFNNDFRNKRSHWSQSHPSELYHKNPAADKGEAWKRRRRANMNDQIQSQPPPFQQAVINNGSREHPNSAGILGWGPVDMRRQNRSHPGRFPPGQGRQPEFK